MRHTRRFREAMTQAGFELLPGETPIIPVMLGDARLAQGMAAALDKRGVYVAGFFYPVVPKGRARIRTQMSAALSDDDLTLAIDAFVDAGRELGVT
jgi:glycine C-acetyltransferase